MERMVLFTASTYSHIVNFHLPYLREFCRRGWRVDVACGGAAMEIPEADRVLPVPFAKSITAPENLSALRLLRREIRREKYELISCHTSLASFFTRMAVYGLHPRPAVVCTVHGYLFDDKTPSLRRALLYGAERLAAPVTDLLLTMNRWDHTLAVNRRLGREIIKIPGMGVDFERLKPAEPGVREKLRRECGFRPEDFLLVYAAEFSARKSQSVLLRALARLPERVGLLLPGQGALREECMLLAERLGLKDRVVFPGQVTDMSPWYAAADAAVSSSRSEGLPFNIMEAMARELPVVASAVKGHTDLLSHGKTGLLYPYGDDAACAACVRNLLEDPLFAARLADAAKRSVRRYSLPEVLPEIMHLYARIIPIKAETANIG
jgi:glycosyltransferase EpsD